MANLLPAPKWRLTKNDGTPAAGWIVNTYTTGGAVTGKATYTTADASVSNGNSFTLDARGEADVWWNGLYYIAVYKSAAEGGALVFNIDNYGDASNTTTDAPNFILNGSFENGTDGTGAPNNWQVTTYTGSTFSVDTVSVAHGGYAAKAASVGNGGAVLVTDSFTACSENESLPWNFMLRSSVADVRNLVEVLWFDSTQSGISNSSLYDNSTTNPTSWTLFQGIAVPPANARFYKVRVSLCHPSDATVGNASIDGIHIGISPIVGINKALLYEGPINYVATSGTDTYTATFTPSLAAYVTGAEYHVSVGSANTSTTPTININGLGAKTIKRIAGTALLASDLNGEHILRFNGTDMILLNPHHVMRDEILGAPTATTAAAGTATTQVATTAFVNNAVKGSVPILGTKIFGGKDVPANVTRYVGEMGVALTATEADRIFWVNQPVMLRDLLVTCNTAVTGGTLTIVWRKNGADTALTTALVGGTTSSDTSNTISAGFGDYLSLKISTSAGFTPTTLDLTITTRFIDPVSLTGISMWPFNTVGSAAADDRMGALGNTFTAANKVRAYKPFVHSNVYVDKVLAADTSTGIVAITLLPATTQVWKGSFSGSGGGGGIHSLGSGGVNAAYMDRMGVPIASQSFLDAIASVNTTFVANGSFSFIQKEATSNNQIMPIWLTSVAHAQNTTLYMAGHGGTGSATESEYQFRLNAGTLKNFFLYNTAAGVAGQTWTATLRKNGADTAIVLTISGTGQVAVDTSSTVTSVDTDLWSVRLVSSATTGTSTLHFAMDHVP